MTAAVVAPALPWFTPARTTDVVSVRVALLGTGAVGSAFLERLEDVQRSRGCRLALVHAANSRRAVSAATGSSLLRFLVPLPGARGRAP